MKISDNLKMTIVDQSGREITGGFYIPEEALTEDGGVKCTDEQAQHFGHQMIAEYIKCKRAIEEHEQNLLDNCTCFWKGKTEEERLVNRCHSSECATWEM